MGPIASPEAPVRNYHCTLHNDSEERSSHLLRSGSLKSRRKGYLKQVHAEEPQILDLGRFVHPCFRRNFAMPRLHSGIFMLIFLFHY